MCGVLGRRGGGDLSNRNGFVNGEE